MDQGGGRGGALLGNGGAPGQVLAEGEALADAERFLTGQPAVVRA